MEGSHATAKVDNRFATKPIYVPVRDELSSEIIAVAEIHETPDLLQERLFNLRLRSWGMTALLTLVVMASLFGIVHRGSRLIEAQHTALQQRITEIRQISDQNHRLRQKAQLASSRLAELNASYLRNVGAELHDGPAQLVGLAALKVEHVRRATSAVTRGRELQAMDMILADALRDIRTISRGLMLPEIEELPLHEVVARAVRLHEKRTGTKVATICGILDCEVSHAVKICVYRFVQEGLSNAFRHAAADGQLVLCDLTASRLMLAVQDQGSTARQKCTARLEGEGGGLGLTGLRARVESLGGTFFTGLTDHGGTRIEMVLTIMGENG